MLESQAGILKTEKVTKLETATLVTHVMEHHALTHSLHFNDYKSEIKWWKNKIFS